jgi:hypothetical protein
MSLNIFTELEITQDLKISNDLEILQNIDICGNILMSGNESTLNLKTIKSNRSTTSDPCGNYVDISGSALLLPRGPFESRMSTDGTLEIGATAKAGMIMYDTSQNQFVGVIDKAAPNSDESELVWTGLGGVISTDQKTRIEATNDGTNSGLEFYTNNSINMFINQDGNVGIGDISKTLLSNTHLNLYKGTTPTFLISGEAKGQQYGLQFQFENNGNAKIYNTFSSGDLIFGTSIPDTTEPTERMRILANGNVGIGTPSPGAPLHVKSTTAYQGIFLDDENGLIVKIARGDTTSDPYLNMYTNNAGSVGVSIHAADKSYFMGGNVGIGTISPNVKLEINGKTLCYPAAPNASAPANGSYGGDGDRFILLPGNSTTPPYSLGIAGGTLWYSVPVNASHKWYVDRSEKMRIDSAGNVGIGTDSPDAKLQVNGDFHIEGTSNAWTTGMGKGLYFRFHNGNGDGYIQCMDRTNNTYYGLQFDAEDYKFRCNGDTKMFIKSDGNVGIGTSSPESKLHIGSVNVVHKNTGSFDTNSVMIVHPNVTSNAIIDDPKDCLFLGRDGTSGEAYAAFAKFSICRYENISTSSRTRLDIGLTHESFSWENVMSLRSNGDVGIGTKHPTCKLHVDGDFFAKTSISTNGDITAFLASDKRLKNNITPIQNPLEKLKKINGYTFDWIEKKDIHSNKGNDIGVIAQEIEEVLPEITTTRDNGYKAVRYEKLTPFLISCIKDQQKQIENQQTQIENQQSQIDELKDLIKNK